MDNQTEIEPNFKAVIESLLFVSGEPLSINKICSLTGLTEDEINALLNELKQDYEMQNRGLRLMENNKQVSLITSPFSSEYVSKLIKLDLEGDLSQAAVETLAITAYKGPLSRLEIDEIRGVNSSYILRSLLLRGLVDRNIHPHRSNAYIYNISNDCLKFLGVSDINQLPDYAKFKEQGISTSINQV